MNNIIVELQELCKDLSEIETLHFFLDRYKSKIALSSSLGAEDQVLTDLIIKHAPQTIIFSLDTGRLPKETYLTMEKTNSFYNIHIKIYFPQSNLVESMVNKKGLFSFYESIENRKQCCEIRKLEPLRRALEGLEVWITGLRRAQSLNREKTEIIEWDPVHNLIKLNPLINWSEQQVWDYIKKYTLPYNSLHDRGYPSIGCEPCTRAVKKGQDLRSGRWWWENQDIKECGLHTK